MKYYSNRKGVALLLALIIIVVSAGLLAAVMYFSTTGTEIAGMQRKYHNAKEASLGSIAVLTKEIAPRILTGEQLSLLVGGLTSTSIIPAGSLVKGSITDANFTAKLTSNTADWPAACSKTMDANDSPDVTFNLSSAGGSGTNPIEVNMKIVDSSRGNSDTSNKEFLTTGVVSSGGGVVPVKHLPYVYTILTEGKLKNSGASDDRATLEVLYAF